MAPQGTDLPYGAFLEASSSQKGLTSDSACGIKVQMGKSSASWHSFWHCFATFLLEGVMAFAGLRKFSHRSASERE